MSYITCTEGHNNVFVQNISQKEGCNFPIILSLPLQNSQYPRQRQSIPEKTRQLGDCKNTCVCVSLFSPSVDHGWCTRYSEILFCITLWIAYHTVRNNHANLYMLLYHINILYIHRHLCIYCVYVDLNRLNRDVSEYYGLHWRASDAHWMSPQLLYLYCGQYLDSVLALWHSSQLFGSVDNC